MSTRSFNIDLSLIPNATNVKFGIVVSNWNGDITNNLLNGSLELLDSVNVPKKNIQVMNVPGSFELIYGCRKMQNNQGIQAHNQQSDGGTGFQKGSRGSQNN